MLDNILKELQRNLYNCDETAQLNDMDLICKFLRYKYNNDELGQISNHLIAEIKERQKEPLLWFGAEKLNKASPDIKN